MESSRGALRAALFAALLSSAGGCAGLMQRGVREVSADKEPPQTWQAGVEFLLGHPVLHQPRVNYTTRVEFTSGATRRVVTNAAVFTSPGGQVRTPWYRLRPGEDPIALRVTVEHPGGVRTTAEYPLFVKKGEFYSVGASVYTRQPAASHLPYLDINPVSFPLNPRAAAQPGDSLWVSIYITPRDCFNCIT